jgi:hypothetical protein
MTNLYAAIQNAVKPHGVKWVDLEGGQLRANKEGVYPIDFPALLLSFNAHKITAHADGSEDRFVTITASYAEKPLGRTHSVATQADGEQGVAFLTRFETVKNAIGQLDDGMICQSFRLETRPDLRVVIMIFEIVDNVERCDGDTKFKKVPKPPLDAHIWSSKS